MLAALWVVKSDISRQEKTLRRRCWRFWRRHLDDRTRHDWRSFRALKHSPCSASQIGNADTRRQLDLVRSVCEKFANTAALGPEGSIFSDASRECARCRQPLGKLAFDLHYVGKDCVACRRALPFGFVV